MAVLLFIEHTFQHRDLCYFIDKYALKYFFMKEWATQFEHPWQEAHQLGGVWTGEHDRAQISGPSFQAGHAQLACGESSSFSIPYAPACHPIHEGLSLNGL